MSFVRYPGFPLTDLPTEIREALRGGLFVVMGINVLLAVAAATVVAGKKGQPGLLWVGKCLVVGGLAMDQLLQLPDEKDKEKKR